MLLKDAIAEKHKAAEQMAFNQRMFRGELSHYEYAMYLYQLLQVFSTLELRMLPSVHLHRTSYILEDIRELNVEQQLYVLETTQHYVNYLRVLPENERLPHIYLHYLALLFGGQIMAAKVPGSGKIYQFEHMRECVQSIRDIQQNAWADEANRGLDYFMDILDELQHLS